ncbi:terminase small subunit [Pseudarcicella hirudinis]|uniref:terminase small subunit n=1 Tax=Pseudarcicella hirudinis TaxID=1079859 RepID=UPI0035E9F8EA
MAAPAGNKFWQNRSRHGRDKLFENPELLWGAACEYFQSVDDNPYLVQEQRKGQVNLKIDAKLNADALSDITDALNPLISIPTIRPYTIAGLCIYVNASRSWWNSFKDSASEDFFGSHYTHRGNCLCSKV